MIVERASTDVHTTRIGRLYIVCACQHRIYLGRWAAAHLSACDMTTTCRLCRRAIVVRREEMVE
jgi:hypothetical protein